MSEPKEMNVIGVGFPSPVQSPGMECSQIVVDENGIFLLLHLHDISPGEQSTWQSGEWEFGIESLDGYCHIMLRNYHKIFKKRDCITEYFINFQGANDALIQRYLTPRQPEESFFFRALLVDLESNVVKAFRLFGLSKKFNDTLQEIIAMQVNGNLNPTKIPVKCRPPTAEDFFAMSYREKAGTK